MITRFGSSLLGVDAPPPPRVRWWHVVVPAVLGTLIALFRVPPAHWNILWAEDGAIFVTGAYRGNPAVIGETFVGYLHVIPRLIAGLVTTVVPVEWVPLGMAVAAAVIAGAVATAVFLFARLRLRSAIVAGLLALAVVVLPMAGGEVALSVANLHWYLIFGAFWAAIVTPTSRWLTIVQCVVVASAILSDPLAALIVAPLVLVRLLAVRPLLSRAHAVTFTFVGASVVQGVASVIATFIDRNRSPSAIRPNAVEFVEAYTGRVVLESFVGVSGSTALYALLGAVALVLATALAVGIVAVVMWRDPSRRWMTLAFALASVGFSVVVFVLKWDGLVGAPPGAITPGGRYLVVPILLLVSVYAIAADRFAGTQRTGWIPVALLAAIVVIPGVVDYRVADSRSDADPWPTSLATAAAYCDADPTLVVAPAPIAPSWFTPAFVPCDLLTHK